jgi:DNA repair exonuclease SbcCD ATPase subunit
MNVEQLMREYDTAKAVLDKEKTALKEAKRCLRGAEEGQKLIQVIAQKAQTTAHSKISGMVTKCLKAVFGAEAYEFKVEFEKKRGKTEAKLTFVRSGEEFHPTTECGLGQVDVASLALRLICLLMKNPPARRVLVLDEPMKWVSKKYVGRVGSLLQQLSSELDLQIIMVTHNEELREGLKAGKVIELSESGVKEYKMDENSGGG